MEYRTELTPVQKELDKPKVERYTSPQGNKPFSYEPVCVGCRENSSVIFKASCEGCRERSRLLAKQKGLLFLKEKE